MMVGRRLAVGALLAASAAASHAMAAPSDKAPPVDRFSVNLSARAEYDTNISGASEAEARARGITIEDWVYTPTVSVNLNLPVSRQTFYLRGSAGYLFHDKNKSLDSERITLDTGVQGRISLCNVTVGGNYQRSLSSLDDIVLGPTIDNILEVKSVGATAVCARKTGFGLTGAVTQEWGDNSTTLMQTQDYESTTYTGGVVYTRPRFGTLTVFGRHQRIDYVNRVPSLGVLGGPNGYDSASGGVSYERHLGARIDGTVSASYTSVDSLGPVVPGTTSGDFSGFTYSLNARYRVTNRLTTEFLFSREVAPSNRFGDSYDLSENYEVRGTYNFGSRITGNLGYQHRNVDSKGGQIFAGNLTDSRSNVVTAGLSYRQSKRVSLNLDAAHEERRANDPRYNYDNTRVGIAASVDY
jgi:hypothetical protein